MSCLESRAWVQNQTTNREECMSDYRLLISGLILTCQNEYQLFAIFTLLEARSNTAQHIKSSFLRSVNFKNTISESHSEINLHIIHTLLPSKFCLFFQNRQVSYMTCLVWNQKNRSKTTSLLLPAHIEDTVVLLASSIFYFEINAWNDPDSNTSAITAFH